MGLHFEVSEIMAFTSRQAGREFLARDTAHPGGCGVGAWGRAETALPIWGGGVPLFENPEAFSPPRFPTLLHPFNYTAPGVLTIVFVQRNFHLSLYLVPITQVPRGYF